MKLPQTGGCLCGAIRYEITAPPLVAYTCHCTACQRLTGSAFSSALVVAAEACRFFAEAEPRSFRRTADSGRHGGPLGLRGLRRLGLQRRQAGHGSAGRLRRGAGGHAGRHLLAAADGALLDPQRPALGRAARGRHALRDAARKRPRLVTVHPRSSTPARPVAPFGTATRGTATQGNSRTEAARPLRTACSRPLGLIGRRAARDSVRSRPPERGGRPP